MTRRHTGLIRVSSCSQPNQTISVRLNFHSLDHTANPAQFRVDI
jgi:hypothetical protein